MHREHYDKCFANDLLTNVKGFIMFVTICCWAYTCILHINVCIFMTRKYCHLVMEYVTVMSLPFSRYLHIPHSFSTVVYQPPLTRSCWVGNTIRYSHLAPHQHSNTAWKLLSISFQETLTDTKWMYKWLNTEELQFKLGTLPNLTTVYDQLSLISDCLVKIQQSSANGKSLNKFKQSGEKKTHLGIYWN